MHTIYRKKATEIIIIWPKSSDGLEGFQKSSQGEPNIPGGTKHRPVKVEHWGANGDHIT